MNEQSNNDETLRKRNLVLGWALFAMVALIGVVSYFKIDVVTP